MPPVLSVPPYVQDASMTVSAASWCALPVPAARPGTSSRKHSRGSPGDRYAGEARHPGAVLKLREEGRRDGGGGEAAAARGRTVAAQIARGRVTGNQVMCSALDVLSLPRKRRLMNCETASMISTLF